MTDVVSKLWSFCHTLRHDGVDYSDYIEQITYLLFLRMAGERGLKLPTGQQWEDVRSLDDNWLLAGYQSVLDTLGKQADLLGEIFDGAQSKFTRSESLRHIMNLIEETKWSSLDVDIQAAAFEGLLDRAASEGKKGAGQYFTPSVA
jgi:type I restriction enzyme M protein